MIEKSNLFDNEIVKGTPILSPKVDYVFKLLLGDEKNIEILRSFLKATTDLSDDELNEITIVDPHMKRRDEADKLSILDVHVKTKEGYKIDIEIQVAQTENFIPRVLYYNSRMIGDQLGRGADYLQIKKVISIVIADFTLFNSNQTYKHRFKYYDVKSDNVLLQGWCGF